MKFLSTAALIASSVFANNLLPVECIPDLNIAWAPAVAGEPKINIQISAKMEPNMWVGVGASKTGGMLGNRAMVALILDDGTVRMQEYQVYGYGLNRAILPISSLNVTSKPQNFHYNRRTKVLMFSFDRELTPKDTSVVPIFTDGTPNYLMCARGPLTSKNEPGFHGDDKNTVEVYFNANY